MLAVRHTFRHFGRQALRQAPRIFLSTVVPEANLIINAVGKDRLGIVSDVTKMVIDAGGNVGDSQAAKLGSHFSLMMLVTLPKEKVDAFKTSLDSLSDMNAAVYEAEAGDISMGPEIGYMGEFSLEGADNPGIVHKITSALAKHGLSIETMHTDQDIAPYGGAMLFRMHGVVQAAAPLASGFNPEKIKEDLSALGDSLNCEVTLQHVQ